MANELMYFDNDDKQNYPFCRLQLVGANLWTINLVNQPIKIQTNKVVKSTNKKALS